MSIGEVIEWDWFILKTPWLPSFDIAALRNSLFRDVFAGLSVATITLTAQNTLMGKTKAVQNAWKDDLSVVLEKAIQLERSVQITLDTRKVYIGQVFDTMEPDEDSSFLSIVPLLSGYRDEKTLELTITHRYQKIVNSLKNKEEAGVESYQFVIPKTRIITCHIFDADTYTDVKKQSNSGLGKLTPLEVKADS